MHGFHSYPARLHPGTARVLVEELTSSNQRVLDPFAGSGTVLVEARALGRPSTGGDVNPLALELSWLKTLAPSPDWVLDLVESAERVHAFAERRRKDRAGPLTRYDARIRESFPVHVLLELDSLRHGVSEHAKGEVARALTLVLSSLVTKVSLRESDSSERRVARRLRSGFTNDAFLEKSRELGRRLSTYSALARSHPAPRILAQDARRMRRIGDDSIDAVVTSPPYPGVFDYLEHHRLRFAFFDANPEKLAAKELGARRRFRVDDGKRAVARWHDEFLPCLKELRRVLRPGGRAALVMGDSAVAGEALRADEYLRAWAGEAGLLFVCRASQRRPNFHKQSRRAFAKRPRAEHLILLEKE